MIGLGDGGSEYDPNNISQDDHQLSGKLLKIDLAKLGDRDFTNSPPVATFSDLKKLGVQGAFTPLLKACETRARYRGSTSTRRKTGTTGAEIAG
jgi:hypothetical protein